MTPCVGAIGAILVSHCVTSDLKSASCHIRKNPQIDRTKYLLVVAIGRWPGCRIPTLFPPSAETCVGQRSLMMYTSVHPVLV